jgi:DNA-directed RNA polymerase sigma subunit (sigma70/sigma32)
LLKAAETWSEARGVAFSTYAVRGIRWAIIRELHRLRAGDRHLSLDAPTGPDGSTLAEEVPAPAESEGPDAAGLAAALAQLPTRWAEEVASYYGLGGRERRTIYAIAGDRGVSHQAVAQRLKAAHSRLRAALAE